MVSYDYVVRVCVCVCTRVSVLYICGKGVIGFHTQVARVTLHTLEFVYFVRLLLTALPTRNYTVNYSKATV